MHDHSDPNEDPLATLRLFAEDLMPEDVERIMELKAEYSAPKGGGLLRRGDGSCVPARIGTWFITTESRKVGDRPEAHLSWILHLLEKHLPRLREHIPQIQADLSLLVHDRNFEIAKIPEELLRHAVSVGDLEIEIPGRGIDVVLTPSKVSAYLHGQN